MAVRGQTAGDAFMSAVPEAGAPSTPASAGMSRRWSDWIADPANSAMLLQTGINMLQPMGIGQTTLGGIAAAVGGGMEARDRVVQGRNETRAEANQQQLAAQEAAQNERRLGQTDRQLDIAERAEERLRQYQLVLGGGRTGNASQARLQNADFRKFLALWAQSKIENTDGFSLDPEGDIARYIMEMATQRPEEIEEAWRAYSAVNVADTGGPTGAGPAGSDPIAYARDLIARGAARESVIEQLRSIGIEPPADL